MKTFFFPSVSVILTAFNFLCREQNGYNDRNWELSQRYQRLSTCGRSPKCMSLFHSAWSRYKSERRILFTAHFKKADRDADGFSKTGELNPNVKWNIDENALPQTVLILISTSLGWKRPIFCGCDIFHSYKTSRFLSDVYELHGKKKSILQMVVWLSSAWNVKFHYLSTFWGLKIKKEQLLMGLKVDCCNTVVTVEGTYLFSLLM